MVTQATADDCAGELDHLAAALASLAGADGADAATRRAYLRLRHARLSGVLDELRAADACVGAALRSYPDWPDLSYLRASADLDLHQPGAALARLDTLPELARSPAGLELRGAALEQAALGDHEAADALYARAEDELTAKHMSSFAWVRAARGDLAAASGDHEAAWAHLRVASAAFEGYWLVESRVARLLCQQGRLDEAAAAYAAVRERTGRPDLAEALAQVHRPRGDNEQAARWQATASAEYADSAARGEALYLHHHDPR
jgi:tetratricopeptide (TPR) repeat protein